MATNTGPRKRSRVTPVKKSGSQVLGKMFPWNTNIKNWHPTPNQTLNHSFNLNYLEGEFCMDELHPGPPYKSGGPFKHLYVNRCSPYGVVGVNQYFRMKDSDPSAWQKYVGGFSPPDDVVFGGVEVSNPNTVLTATSSLYPSMVPFSSQAWSRTKPRIQQNNLLVSVAELRDLSRMARSCRDKAKFFHKAWKDIGGLEVNGAMFPKKLANEFLENQFGWQPFLSDLRQLYATYHGSDRILKHLSERNGKPTRREATIVGRYIPPAPRGALGSGKTDPGAPDAQGGSYDPDRTDIKTGGGTGQICNPSLNANFFSVSPTWERREIVETIVRASGKFSYYRPEFDTGLNDYSSPWFAIQRQLTLYGLRISPSNVWRATPWTWLIDWFTTVGEHFDLLTDVVQDSVVCHYLYITQHKRRTWKVIQHLPFAQTGMLTLEWTQEIESKERVGASSPFGVSLTWDSLTPRQLVILAALGISRERWSGR